MNLLDVRRLFVKLSGREDLKNEIDDSDNGADYFINAGSKWLDEQLDSGKAEGRNYRLAQVGQFVLPIKSCRAVNEVWVTEGTNPEWVRLVRKDLSFFKFQITNISQATRDTPLCYMPTNLRTSPSTDRPADPDFFDSYANLSDYIAEAHYPYQGILLWPVPARIVQVEIKGIFYQDLLENDGDFNYWSTQHPTLLINAALRELEVSYRNTQGVRDWEADIVGRLANLDKDSVYNDNVDVVELGG